MYLLWWIIADKVNSFGPNLSPHVHVVAHVDGAADPTAGGPNQLQQITIALVVIYSVNKVLDVNSKKRELPVCNVCRLGPSIWGDSTGHTPEDKGRSSLWLRHTRPAHGTWVDDTWREWGRVPMMTVVPFISSCVSIAAGVVSMHDSRPHQSLSHRVWTLSVIICLSDYYWEAINIFRCDCVVRFRWYVAGQRYYGWSIWCVSCGWSPLMWCGR